MTDHERQPQDHQDDEDLRTDVVVDIEEHCKSGRPTPHATRYAVRIDKAKYEVSAPTITGRALLTLAGKQPVERYAIYEKLKGGRTVRIELDQTVDLRAPGLERFVTLPLDQTEG